ncbi:MAG TPA: Gfo/Idh/MocA family oxidoreductase [Streptosporangiaceae bacterium]|nr:Gfo/Idh/MocA family oxidoreductase [Streptosporangiaceae bacterium]
MGGQPVRWGILSTANIARAAFLPGMRAAGGVAEAVASRNAESAQRYADAHGIARALGGYQALIEDPDVDAIYIAVPNTLHAEWTIAALEAGKPVLCEKPLTGSLADTGRVLDVAKRSGTLLWEAFVFPFHQQLAGVRAAVAGGAIGELREIHSDFHFRVTRPDNIRLFASLAGGALNDVGCYPIRLAFELFGTEHMSAWGTYVPGGEGVDLETVAVLGYAGGRQLVLSCGMNRSYDANTRLLGSDGEIRMTNPFHPGDADRFEVIGKRHEVRAAAPPGEPSFAPAIRHIQAALSGTEEPRLLAIDTALPTARALDDLHLVMRPAPS